MMRLHLMPPSLRRDLAAALASPPDPALGRAAPLAAKRGRKSATMGGMKMSAPARWNASSRTSSNAMSAWNFMGKNTQKMMLAVSDTPVNSTVLPVVWKVRWIAASKPSPTDNSSTMREST
jgi:hypothetical protein